MNYPRGAINWAGLALATCYWTANNDRREDTQYEHYADDWDEDDWDDEDWRDAR